MSRAYFEIWDAARHRLATEFGHEISLEIEPGRYLVAESGYLITEIRAIKTAARTRSIWSTPASTTWPDRSSTARTTRWRSAQSPASKRAGASALRPCATSSSAARLCESGDIFTQEEGGFVARRALPEADVGDYLVIGYAGAYGYVMASNYNTKPLVAEVLIENGTAAPGPPPANAGRLIRGESIPRSA